VEEHRGLLVWVCDDPHSSRGRAINRPKFDF